MTTLAQRTELGRLMDMLVVDEPKVHYRQLRPMASRSITTVAQLRAKLASNAGIALDCSESVTLLCKLAGLKDPNGLGYDGYGDTVTMLKHLPIYHAPYNANVGALVVFGADKPIAQQHICMVRRRGANPVLFSHGQERGPLYISLEQEAKYHAGAFVFLDISHL